ncbi:MAG: hypothetical protein R2783_01025 [Gelidibacter sp.]
MKIQKTTSPLYIKACGLFSCETYGFKVVTSAHHKNHYPTSENIPTHHKLLPTPPEKQ